MISRTRLSWLSITRSRRSIVPDTVAAGRSSRSSSRCPMIECSGVPTSCATSATIRPESASRSAWLRSRCIAKSRSRARAIMSLKCRAIAPNSSCELTATGSASAPRIARTNRSMGRLTTPFTASVIREPITTTEIAVSQSAAERLRVSRSSKRASAKRAATAPATAPSRWMGAITSHERPPASESRRETTAPPRTEFSSAAVNGRRNPGSLVATTAAPSGGRRTMSSCRTLRRTAMIWWILRSTSAPASSS